ncbi:MAG: hypothetical protein QW334_01200 [Thermofilum sp.]
MRKVRVSFTIGEREALRLKRLAPFSSSLVSALLRELFEHIPLDEIYACLEMHKPLSPEERSRKLEAFVRSRMRFVSPEEPGGKRLTPRDAWEKFGS